MIAENTREPEMGLTFEKVWAMFQETDRKFRETDRKFQDTDRKFQDTDRKFQDTDRNFQDTDRKFQETDRKFQDTDRKFQETDRKFQDTDRKFQDTDRKISKLGGRFGEMVEHLVAPNILEKFNALGFNFGKAGTNVRFKGPNMETLAEVDILLENGDVSLAVEVKAKLTIPDVQEHIARMEKLRRYADAHGDSRKLMGAVAGAIISGDARPFAHRSGFFVLEQAGDTVKIDIPGDFTPKEW
jgi:hypothetical protein